MVGASLSKKVYPEAEGETFIFASVMRLLGEVLTKISHKKEFASHPIDTTLQGLEKEKNIQKIMLNDIPLYSPRMRRELDIIWRPIEKVGDCKKIQEGKVAPLHFISK